MYIKPKIFHEAVKKQMLDLRHEDKLSLKEEERRMNREKIPDDDESVFRMGVFWSTEKLSSRSRIRLQVLLKFFTLERRKKMLVPIISVTSDISLRALDWFVINYAKKHKIALISHKSHVVNVYSSYRAWLHYWKRSLFDAFRRGTRVYFDHEGFTYSTTVAQLNFLYWAEVVGVLRFAKDNIKVIEADMNARIAECKAEKERIKKNGGKRKRSELSKSTNQICAIYSLPSTITFT